VEEAIIYDRHEEVDRLTLNGVISSISETSKTDRGVYRYICKEKIMSCSKEIEIKNLEIKILEQKIKNEITSLQQYVKGVITGLIGGIGIALTLVSLLRALYKDVFFNINYKNVILRDILCIYNNHNSH